MILLINYFNFDRKSVMSCKVNVQYCGGWGYKRFYVALERALMDEFDDSELVVTPQEDPGTTGNFEITIVNTGELIHSKKTMSQGRCETQEETQAVVAKIRAFLDSK